MPASTPYGPPGGDAAYLKLTPAALGPDALAAAHRELRFYRELAARAPVRTPRLLDAADDGNGVALLLAEAGVAADVRSWTPGMWAALGRDPHTTPQRASSESGSVQPGSRHVGSRRRTSEAGGG